MMVDSLNKKTALLLSIITILLISGSVFFVSLITKKQMQDKYKKDKDTTIDVLSYSLAPMLSLYNHKQIENLISSSLNYKKILYIAVFNENGTLIRSATKQVVPSIDLDIENRKITTNLEGIIGSVEIGFSKAYINKRIRTVTAALTLVLVGSYILVGLCLYALMRRYIIVPLESLTRIVKKMGPDHLSKRAEIIRKDEIGTLAGSFNEMAEKLEISSLAIKESESKYRSMMEAMSDSVYICSPEYVITYMNPALIKETGRDAIGEHCYKVVFGSDEKCPWCRFRDIKQGKTVTFDIVVLQDSQHYQMSNAALIHRDKTVSMMTVLRNTTKLKNLENSLIQAQKMESIGTLAAGIAHDFNNILSAIFGYAEIALNETPNGSNIKNHLAKILKAGERARTLAKQILTFSRKAETEKKPIQVHLIVNEVIKFLRSSLPSTIQIKQHTKVKHDTILADPTQIHQIVMNLCTNAGQAMMEKGGELEVLLENVKIESDDAAQYPDIEPGAYLKLTVKDTGYGMSSAVLDRIFEPYFTTKEKGMGTGLGMAVVLGILESHNGHIKVESEKGVGSSFYIYLPLVDDQENLSEAPVPALPIGNESILIVDDEHAITETGKLWLENLGYKVFAVNSSAEALALFRHQSDQIDLVITDMTMPHMTGCQLVKELRKTRRDIPIILCSGHISDLTHQKSKEMGVEKLVQKPIHWRVMSIIIRDVIDEATSQRI